MLLNSGSLVCINLDAQAKALHQLKNSPFSNNATANCDQSQVLAEKGPDNDPSYFVTSPFPKA